MFYFQVELSQLSDRCRLVTGNQVTRMNRAKLILPGQCRHLPGARIDITMLAYESVFVVNVRWLVGVNSDCDLSILLFLGGWV
ncbi:hypothetical protein B5X24_HaOG212774 [Helicoverpa armigera]|uniref:Uncharacterized protein n=1 Tax=Helicoverpa armigera TaxID=29058 RepID=A0A2W1B6E8_HELAM|nr:hypothetical protein B5X24_HaOG212774 [Helicoverpa armigera]